MIALEQVDRATVTVLVDNATDFLSSVPAAATSEVPNLLSAGMTELSGNALCCPHFGLSLLVTVEKGAEKRSLLFDAGPEDFAIRRNIDRLRIDPGEIGGVMLSHGHWDHAGGLLEVVGMIHEASERPVPVHIHPGMQVRRGLELADGRMVVFEEVPNSSQLVEKGGVEVDTNDESVVDHWFYISGEIPRQTTFETGFPNHFRMDDAGEWEDDPFLMDERYLAIRVRDRGIVVFTACSHAGVVNVLQHARDRFAPVPVYGVMGGFHLAGGPMEPRIPDTVAAMKELPLGVIVPGHCTGWRAVHRLVEAFGEEIVIPSSVGRRHTF